MRDETGARPPAKDSARDARRDGGEAGSAGGAPDELPRFDFDELFDDDYLYFYKNTHSEEFSEAATEKVWKLLELEPGRSILDLACGTGRIANRLAQRGCHVTGLDRSSRFLELARADAASRGVEVEYVRGDMRRIPWRNRFDRVLNWFTSFGYFDDAENRQVLVEAHAALRVGGLFLVETLHRDRLLKGFHPDGVIERDANYMIDRHRYELLADRLIDERIIVRDQRVRRMQFFVRCFTFVELRDWLLQAGFAEVRGCQPDGEPLTLESPRMIWIARK